MGWLHAVTPLGAELIEDNTCLGFVWLKQSEGS